MKYTTGAPAFAIACLLGLQVTCCAGIWQGVDGTCNQTLKLQTEGHPKEFQGPAAYAHRHQGRVRNARRTAPARSGDHLHQQVCVKPSTAGELCICRCAILQWNACMHNERLLCCNCRGMVYGQLLVQKGADGSWVDCSVGVQTIPGDCTAIGAYLFQSTARQERLTGRSCSALDSVLVRCCSGKMYLIKTWM